MCRNPLLGLLSVRACPKQVDDDYDNNQTENHTLLLEVAQAVAFMDVVPFCVRHCATGWERCQSCEAWPRDSGRQGRGFWVWSSCEIRKVWRWSVRVILFARGALPESPAGIGDADGFEPPKRLLINAAILGRCTSQERCVMFSSWLEGWGGEQNH